ncbi:nucleotide exchange factor GrpE [Mycoplasma corogypsi]|uniref:nucleotide exchange factor GrpE n=1 Tax=Mycoplasma corogypsi TaxID=2106 RepID=UPI0038738C5A
MKFEKNQVINAHFSLLVSGIEIPEYSGVKEIQLGKEQYLENFDHFLINRKISKELQINVPIAKKFHDPNIAGRTVLVHISNIKVSEGHEAVENAEPKQESKTQKISELELKNQEIKKLEEQLNNLRLQLAAKELELIKLQSSFLTKAKEIQEKAVEELAKSKQELQEKVQKEKNEIKRYALVSFVEEFIRPYSLLVSAVKSGDNIDNQLVQNYCQGFKLILNQMELALNDHEITFIEPQIGSEFDAHTQEVVSIEENKEKPDNTILKVTLPGIKVADRVVKPAGVVVSKK